MIHGYIAGQRTVCGIELSRVARTTEFSLAVTCKRCLSRKDHKRMKQFLIAIEGPDKIGKATQSRLLAARLKLDLAEIPYRDGATHTKIYAMLKDGSAKVDKEAFQAFHVANRLVWQAMVLPTLGTGVVLDRWNASTWAYGVSSGLSYAKVESILGGTRRADLTIVLDGEMIGEPEDCYERDKALRERVRTAYRNYADDHRCPVIDANRDRMDVHADIFAEVEKAARRNLWNHLGLLPPPPQ